MTDAGFDRCVLVEAPGVGDAGFLADWLRAAKEANEMLQTLMAEGKADRPIQNVFMQYRPDFGWAAYFFMRQLRDGHCTFLVPWREELPELFCCLENLGFFQRTGDRYQMVLPPAANAAKVEQALLRLADTIDSGYALHPEELVVTLARSDAKKWQERLRGMDEASRLADRNILLDTKFSESNTV